MLSPKAESIVLFVLQRLHQLYIDLQLHVKNSSKRSSFLLRYSKQKTSLDKTASYDLAAGERNACLCLFIQSHQGEDWQC